MRPDALAKAGVRTVSSPSSLRTEFVRWHESVSRLEIESRMPSEVKAISPLVDRLIRLIKESHCVVGGAAPVGLALREALSNAVLHDNRGVSGMIASFFAALLLGVIVPGPSTQMKSEFGKMNTKHDARTQVNSSNAAHAPNSPTSLFKRKKDQDYASRFVRQDR